MEKRKLPGKKQWRLLPKYKVDIHSKEYKKKLRDSLLQEWPYAAHWVDSAIKTAYSIFKTWRKNYVKGERGEDPLRKGSLQEPSKPSLSLRVKNSG